MPQVEIKNRMVRMNLDDSYYYLDKTDYIDALNITHDAQDQSEDITNTNITGNRYVPYTFHDEGTRKTIGAKADILRNRVFEFVWLESGYHSIVIYDRTTDVRSKLIENLTDTDNVDVLQFTENNKINHCDIIYRGEDEGDLLFWTDGNVTPRKLNVKHIQEGSYTFIKVPFIELAKMPPINPIVAEYGSDATRNSNSLRKKLLMATYRWSYDDFEKSTFNTYSKIPLPIGYYGSDNDIDNTKNNFITFTVETGDENVTDIEIAVRFNIASDWGNFVQIISLNKEQLGIADNITYQYLFYNDAIYPPLEVEEVTQLFDYVPQKAKSQCLPNGNVVAFGAITEGYDNYPVNELDVNITAENLTNVPPDTDPAQLTYFTTGFPPVTWTFTVAGTVTTGTVFRILANIPSGGVQTFALYTALGGDDPTDVSLGLWTYINSNFPGYPDGVATGATFFVKPPLPGFYVVGIQIDIVGGSDISTEKTWLWDCNIIFGQVYKDGQGRAMPGVTTKVNPIDSDNDYLVTTPSFSLDSGSVQTPVITATVNHTPPEGAVTWSWVRRRMTYSDFLMYETCDYQSDADFLYFCLANIEKYKLDNSQFIYGTVPITTTSRIKIMANVVAGVYDGNIHNEDYEILGTVTKTLTGGSSPDDDRLFIKVTKPAAAISPAYSVNMLVMVYTPMANPTDIADSVYWEWGEEYGIYAIGDINYHRGLDQDQTASQPAIFTWAEGDVYFHQRTMFNDLLTPASDTLPLMDANWSDFFLSAVNDNGRALTIEVNARQTFFPATIRFSREYQQNTNINQTNRFVFLNFIDLDRSFGSILKMSIKDRYIRIGQQFKLGSVPIFNQISKDSAGSVLVAATDVLLNPVQYYLGDYGIGDAPEAWTDYNFSSYSIDTNRGIDTRLSRDGVIPISVLYKINSWLTQHGVLRGQDFKVYGVFDPKSNNRIFAFEEINIYQSIGNLVSLKFDIGLNDYVFFHNSVNPNITVSLALSATNGDSQSISYVTVDGETTITLRNNLIALLNSAPGTLFNGTPVFDVVFLYGIIINNIAGFGVTTIVTIEGNLIFHDDAYTIAFDEENNAYASFLSYHPEMMCALGSLLMSWKDGNLWTHDGTVYNNFYGVQYSSYIEPVFNDQAGIKKKYLGVGYKSLNNVVWESPENGDIITSTINPQTLLPQISQLKTVDYELEETTLCAGLLTDANSLSDAREALINGDPLGGNYLAIKFICPANKCGVLVNLTQPYLTWVASGRNF